MKITITGASVWVKRMFEACGKYQWAREFLRNSIEAGADRVEFGLEWEAVEQLGCYRRVISDNGCGMDRDELRRFFSTLGEGAKMIGGLHGNFGVGAKIASLPWNPKGVVVISYKKSTASMIWIQLDDDSGDYELLEFESEIGTTCVVDPSEIDWDASNEIDWSSVAPNWTRDHGTIIVLLGSEDAPDTVLGNGSASEDGIKGLSVFLNTRFWDLTSPEVHVMELRSERRQKWPTGSEDKENTRRANRRRILGARHFLADVAAQNGKLGANGRLLLDEDRVAVDWYLWDGNRPHVDSYARKNGYVALRYRDELFEVDSGKVAFRRFGIIESDVQRNLSLIIEPVHYDPDASSWGVHPDQSRNRLNFTGNGEKGTVLPMDDWGSEFADNIPDSIYTAIQAARNELAGTIEDDEYRKRLQDKFGDRWTVKRFVEAKQTETDTKPATTTDEIVDVVEHGQGKGRRKRRRRKSIRVVRKVVAPGGDVDGVEIDVAVDVPRYRFAHKDEFEQPWHIVLWAPNAVDGPEVVLNLDSLILEEIVKHHQAQYPLVHAEEVAETVRKTFGEVAACKIAHSQKLTKQIAEEELDREYRSEAALTVSLMGLLAEETLINQRLKGLGKKRGESRPAPSPENKEPVSVA